MICQNNVVACDALKQQDMIFPEVQPGPSGGKKQGILLTLLE